MVSKKEDVTRITCKKCKKECKVKASDLTKLLIPPASLNMALWYHICPHCFQHNYLDYIEEELFIT